MKPPSRPPNEDQRLRTLHSLNVLDTPPEPNFDGITELAAEILGVPIALVSIVDGERQWFKSRFGLKAKETPREVSFCAHVVATGDPLIVSDAFSDERFHDNPLVTGDPHVRFYAGYPLEMADGSVLGTLCAIDHAPRAIEAKQLHLLELLAKQVVELIAARRASQIADEDRLASAALDELRSPVGFWDTNLRLRFANRAYEDWFGIPHSSLVGKTVVDVVGPEMAALGRPYMEAALRGERQSLVRQHPGRDGGSDRWAMVEYLPCIRDGKVVGIFAVSLDATAQVHVENELREILDHMDQAVVVFGADGVLGDVRSAAAVRMFGDLPAGANIHELLDDDGHSGSTQRQLLEVWFEVAFGVAADAWEEIESVAPTEVTIRNARTRGVARTLELSFRPVFEGGVVARLLLIATDVTEKRTLTFELEDEKRRHESDLATMRRVVMSSGQAFAEFLQTTERRLASTRKLFDVAELEPSTLERALQGIHTLRAEARSFDLEVLSLACSELEEGLAPLRDMDERARFRWGARRPLFLELVDRGARAITRARELFVEASPTGAFALELTGVRRADLEALGRLVAGRGDEIEVRVDQLRSRPFGECAAGIDDKTSYWSQKEGRPALLQLHGRDVLVPPALASVLGGVLAHLVRNSIAHGLELGTQRVAQGKDPVGLIEARAAYAPDASGRVIISVRDDGRGVDEERLRAKVLGTAHARDSIDALLFAPGISTSESLTELAGLGVGLAAVRDELAAVGYEVSASWEKGQGTTFTIRSATERFPDFAV